MCGSFMVAGLLDVPTWACSGLVLWVPMEQVAGGDDADHGVAVDDGQPVDVLVGHQGDVVGHQGDVGDIRAGVMVPTARSSRDGRARHLERRL